MKGVIQFMLPFVKDAKKNRESKRAAKERISVYRQHIRQLQYQQLAVKEDLRTYGNKKFHMFFLFFFQYFSRKEFT